MPRTAAKASTMGRRTESHERDAVTRRAAEWLLEVERRDVDIDKIAAWQEWLAEDPWHKEAFDRLQAIQECIDNVQDVPWPTDSEVVADETPESGVFRTRESAMKGGTSARRGQRRYWIGAAAASVALAVFLASNTFDSRQLRPMSSDVVETSTGELRRVQLPDGSMVTVGGRSRIGVEFSGIERRVRLHSGEAYFEIAKETNRPFLVQAGAASIRAVGTAFDVRRTAANGVTVAVAEGVVEMIDTIRPAESNTASTAMRIAAGQQLKWSPSQPPLRVALAPDSVAAWREGRRQYLAEPLADVIADLARYSTRRISIDDPEVGKLSITGAVFEQDIDRWLASLEAALPVSVRMQADGSARIVAAQPDSAN